ncbi:MAG: hypothetical protein ABW176_13020 [Candidatus Thiodiazotropha endolucinida]
MSTISTSYDQEKLDKTLHVSVSSTDVELERDAVLGLESIHQRLCRIDAIYDLLKGMESGDINYDGDITGGITLRTIAIESFERAMYGVFDDYEKIKAYVQAKGGDDFKNLVVQAKAILPGGPFASIGDSSEEGQS